jgi:hypothetical protein
MGKFDETTQVDYHLTLADQGKQTSFRFCFTFAANKQKLPFSVNIYIYVEPLAHIQM